MTSSFYTAMLVREFASPGILDLLRKLVGIRLKKRTKAKPRCWIRLIDIPPSWIAKNGTERGDQQQKLAPPPVYREVVRAVLSLGCIPLGLYRSGRAAVRVPRSMISARPEHAHHRRHGIRAHAPATAATRDDNERSRLLPQPPCVAGNRCAEPDCEHGGVFECPTTAGAFSNVPRQGDTSSLSS